ncbi:MAG: GtrA family protein [Ferruginibacter sp.]
MKTFFKANVSSVTASFSDYLVTIIFHQFLQVDEVLASILGTIFGGMINFLVGRHWVFRSVNSPFFHQGKRYLITWVGNLILNALGVFLLVRLCSVYYIIAKAATSITVAIAYNYPIQKKYVFRNVDIVQKD